MLGCCCLVIHQVLGLALGLLLQEADHTKDGLVMGGEGGLRGWAALGPDSPTKLAARPAVPEHGPSPPWLRGPVRAQEPGCTMLQWPCQPALVRLEQRARPANYYLCFQILLTHR